MDGDRAGSWTGTGAGGHGRGQAVAEGRSTWREAADGDELAQVDLCPSFPSNSIGKEEVSKRPSEHGARKRRLPR